MPRAVLLALSLVALALCAAAWLRSTPSREFFFGGDTLFGLAFAAVLFSFQGVRTWARGAFELRPLVWIGGISYGIYLWHWPIIVYLDGDRTGLSGNAVNVLRVGVTIVVAVVSVRLIERPVRRSRVPVLRWAIPATVVAIVIVLVTTAGATSPPGFALARGAGIRAHRSRAATSPPRPRPWRSVASRRCRRCRARTSP